MTMMNSHTDSRQQGMSRRQLLKTTSCGFGYLAFAGLCQAEAGNAKVNPLSPKQPHFPAKAKRVIFLHMRGRPAQQDTFDYKPKLGEMEGLQDEAQ